MVRVGGPQLVGTRRHAAAGPFAPCLEQPWEWEWPVSAIGIGTTVNTLRLLY